MAKSNALNTINKLAKSYQKILARVDHDQLVQLDSELAKIYPSDESEVLVMTDFDEKDHSIGLSIYVSKPHEKKNGLKKSFDQLIFEYLIRADVEKFPQVSECLKLMKPSVKDKFKIDFIPVSYTKEIDKYDIHLRIAKSF